MSGQKKLAALFRGVGASRPPLSMGDKIGAGTAAAGLTGATAMAAAPSLNKAINAPETAPVVTAAPAASEPTAIDKLKGQLSQGWDKAKGYGEKGWDAAKGYGEKAVNFAKENPGATAAGVAGVGAVGLLSYLLGRRRRPSRSRA